MSLSRRQFVASSLSALGTASILSIPSGANGNIAGGVQGRTVQEIIDLIVNEIPGGKLSQTVDTLKSGQPDQAVSGIVSTMFATVDVINTAIELKANFIIAHEPTFYNHLDDTAWLENDKVYDFKRKLLDDNAIAVWRFHDYWHRHDPDGIRMGVLEDLEWGQYYDPGNPAIITLPPTPLKDIVRHVKDNLHIFQVRIIGDVTEKCSRVALMPGASGGRSHITLLERENPDLLICGEVAEWETAEYIRDARAIGLNRSLMVLGHAQSEEPGMQWLVKWLQPRVGGIKVTHVPSNNPFSFV